MGEYLEMWRQLHPDWDIRLWTDATMRDFVAAHYPEFVSIYDAYPKPIQRADSFRYLVLNILGGVYSDLDVEPFRSINGLIDGQSCFAGVEPDEHMGADRKHSGMPYLVSNAFMGGVPGHAWFQKLVAMLPLMAHNEEVFYSTGPSLTTGASVRLARADRPVLVPPMLWSPLCDKGKPCTTDDVLEALLRDGFDFIWDDRKAYVSHHWLTSWVPWHKRHKWLAVPFHAFHNLKWKLREWRNPALARIAIPDQLAPYHDQVPKVLAPLPKVTICVSILPEQGVAPGLARALAELDYPPEKLRMCIAGFEESDSKNLAKALKDESKGGEIEVEIQAVASPDFTASGVADLLPENKRMIASATLRNALVEAAGDSEWVLFLGGEVEAVPPAILRDALEVGHPVVGLAMVDAAGDEVDLSVHRYHWGQGIRVTYKIRGSDGLANAARGQRVFLSGQKSYRLVPLDGVGRGFVLVRRDVLDAGVRFADRPMDLHLDGEAFALSARRAGFEVAGMTELAVLKNDSA